MGPKPSQPQSGELFRPRLDEQINMLHPLVRLTALIDWTEIERTFAMSFTSGRGRPALPPRLVAGLLYLQHTFDASDEAVVNTWVENPYWQFFCGETYLQTELPIDPSSLTRWRKRIGEEGVETLLAASIEAARRGGVIRKASVQQVIVDTTVMPKAIAHPTDSRLLDKSRQHLVKAAEDNGLQLRQNYNRVAPRLAAQIGRYAHAKQFKRLKRVLRRQRDRLQLDRDAGIHQVHEQLLGYRAAVHRVRDHQGILILPHVHTRAMADVHRPYRLELLERLAQGGVPDAEAPRHLIDRGKAVARLVPPLEDELLDALGEPIGEALPRHRFEAVHHDRSGSRGAMIHQLGSGLIMMLR